MKESAQMAISYLRSNSKELGIENINFSEIDIHLHVPEGAVPKDGPSAGITITTSVSRNSPSGGMITKNNSMSVNRLIKAERI